MKVTLGILTLLAAVLIVPAFLKDMKMTHYTHTTWVVSDGSKSKVVGSKNNVTQIPLRVVARIFLAADGIAILVVLLLWKRLRLSGRSGRSQHLLL